MLPTHRAPRHPGEMLLREFLAAALWLAICAPASGQSNAVQLENAKPGSTDWLLTKVVRHDDEIYELGWHRRRGIEAYTSHTSVKGGDTLNVHVSTYPANQYSVSIYRMGYYGGAGARLMRTIGPLQGTAEPTPKDGDRNLIECNWKVGFSLEIPKDWLSGVYLGKLSTIPSPTGQFLDLEMTSESYVIFIIRDDRKADLLFQASDLTWLSYNRWPQWRSLYDLGTAPWGASNGTVGYDVSFDKPYALFWNGFPAGFHPLTNGSGEFLMTEFPLAFWLEKEGYDVTYISNVDTHADGNGLLRGKVFLSVGHDEVLDPADVRERHEGPRRRRQPRVPVRQLDLRRRRAAAEQRRPSQSRNAARGWRIQGRAGIDGCHVLWRRVRRLDQRRTRSLGVRGDEYEEGGSRRAARGMGIPRSSAREASRARRDLRRSRLRQQWRTAHRHVRDDLVCRSQGQSRVQCRHLLVESRPVVPAGISESAAQGLPPQRSAHPAHHEEHPRSDAQYETERVMAVVR